MQWKDPSWHLYCRCRRYKTLEEGRNTFFHNKYFIEYDHVVMDCMEEEIHSRNKLEYFNDLYN